MAMEGQLAGVKKFVGIVSKDEVLLGCSGDQSLNLVDRVKGLPVGTNSAQKTLKVSVGQVVEANDTVDVMTTEINRAIIFSAS